MRGTKGKSKVGVAAANGHGRERVHALSAVPPPTSGADAPPTDQQQTPPVAAPAAATQPSPTGGAGLSAPARAMFGAMLYPAGAAGSGDATRWGGPIADVERIHADASQLLSIDRSGNNPDFDEYRAIVTACAEIIARHRALGEQLAAIAARTSPSTPTPGAPAP